MSSEGEDGVGNHSETSPTPDGASAAAGSELKGENVADISKKDDQEDVEQTSSKPVLSRKARLERLKERRVSCQWSTCSLLSAVHELSMKLANLIMLKWLKRTGGTNCQPITKLVRGE